VGALHEIRVFMSFDRDRDRDLHERLIRQSHGSDSPFEVADFLVWGRRELTCTKPLSAKPDDSMYTWLRSVLKFQIGSEMRKGTRRGATA